MDSVKRLAWYAPAAAADSRPPQSLADVYPTDTFTEAEPLRRALAAGPSAVVVVPDTDDGSALTEALDAASGQAPVVALLSAEDADIIELRALRAGAAEVLRADDDTDVIARTLARAWARFDRAHVAWHDVASFRTMVEQSHDVISVVDGNGQFVYTSRSVTEQLGFTPDELVGTIAFELMHPGDLEHVFDVFMEAVQEPGATRALQYRIRRKGFEPDDEGTYDDEAYVHLEGAGRALVGRDGKPYAVISARNVTERRRVEASLRESEARLRALIEALPDAIVRVDGTGLILDFRVPESFPSALLPPDVVGKYAQDVLPDDMKPPYARAAIEAFMTNAPVTFRHTTMVDGQPRHHEVCCVPNGTDEVLALVRDQTVQVEAEAALRRQERLLRHIVSTVPVIVFALDGHGRFDLIEGKGLDDIGRTKEELEGSLVPEFFGDNPEIMEALSAALDGESGKTLFLLNGQYFDLWFNPVLDDEGLLTGIIGIAANVTDLIHARDDLEQSRGELRELAAHLQHIREEERTSISREVHDSLGQMLTSIRLDASWVARNLATATDATVQERLARVDTQVDETIQRVRQIAQALRPGILDDIGLASALDWQSHQFAERTGIACSITEDLRSSEADLPRDAATALFRIAQEALTNVARHAEATAVTLHLEESDDELVLHVRDDGKGLDPEAVAHTRSLGMLGMRERAGILGGSVTFDSAPGEGTHVRAAVPLRMAEPATVD